MAGKIDELIEAANSSVRIDASHSPVTRSFETEQEAIDHYGRVKAKMLDITKWDESSSPSSYALFTEDGREISGEPVETGRFIRIAVYGSGKYDWVRVNNIYEAANEFVITVQPSHDPTADPITPDVISHFFRPDARNNFCLRRIGSEIEFHVIGLNEKQNTEFADGLLQTVRNVAAANAGYFLGLQKSMWKEFGNYMLENLKAENGK